MRLLLIFLLKNTSFLLKPMWGNVRLMIPTDCSLHIPPFNKTIVKLYTMEHLCPRQKKQVRIAWLKLIKPQTEFGTLHNVIIDTIYSTMFCKISSSCNCSDFYFSSSKKEHTIGEIDQKHLQYLLTV